MINRLLFALVGFCTIALSISSCSNELELIDTWEDIPVAYALLNRQDSIHYIRVEKAFLDPERSALDVAQISDSLYYDNAQVEVKNLQTEEVYTFERVNATEEGLMRNVGIFATEPNVLYRHVFENGENWVGGQSYELSVRRGDETEPARATATIVSDMAFVNLPDDLALEWVYDRNTTVNWRIEQDARLFNMDIIIEIEEINATNPSERETKFLVWEVDRNIERVNDNSPAMFYTIPGERIYRFIADELEPSSTVNRVFKGFQYRVSASGAELEQFINVTSANTGITSSQVILTYTNIENGVGLFGSSNDMISPQLQLESASRDSLRDGIFTKNLNFL